MSPRNKKIRKPRVLLWIYMLLILFTLLTVASYTWFSLSRTPRVSDMNMYINSQTGLEISDDPLAEEWKLQLDFLDLVEVTSPLRPITWSDNRQQFYAATYGVDGRLMPLSDWQPLSDDRHANKDNLDGFYIKATLYARSDMAMDVSLSPAVEVDEGINGSGTYVIGTPVWDAVSVVHSNGGQGAENAIRIGFRVTPVDETGRNTGPASEMIIYEPNSDVHSDHNRVYVDTPSIDGSASLVPNSRLIRQTTSYWSEAYPIQRDVIIRRLGDFMDDTKLFSLEAGEMVRIDIYVWLEGQDVDCINTIKKAQILASIQFAGDPGTQSGMKPIE